MTSMRAFVDSARTTTFGGQEIRVCDDPLPLGKTHKAEEWRALGATIRAAKSFRVCTIALPGHQATYHIESPDPVETLYPPMGGRMPIPLITWTRDGFNDRHRLRDVAMLIKLSFLAAIADYDS